MVPRVSHTWILKIWQILEILMIFSRFSPPERSVRLRIVNNIEIHCLGMVCDVSEHRGPPQLPLGPEIEPESTQIPQSALARHMMVYIGF